MSGIQANIANFVRQEIRVPKSKPLLPIFEAVSNALDAIEDGTGKGTVAVTVLREPDTLDGRRGAPHAFIVEDDGIGFDDDNIGAFDQLYSDRKMRKGGKGRGRFTYLKIFDDVHIKSTFSTLGKLRTREFDFNVQYIGYQKPPIEDGTKIGTTVKLSGMHIDYADRVPREAETLAREFVSHFLRILLSDREIEIIVDDGQKIHLADFVRKDLLIESTTETYKIGSQAFSVLSVKLRPKLNLYHRLILAASSREVHGDNLEKFIPVLGTGPLELEGESNGFWFVAIVEGQFLDEAVDPMRVTFTNDDDELSDHDAKEDEPLVTQADMFGQPQSIRQIRAEAIKIVRMQLEQYIKIAVEQRSQAIEQYIRRDGMGYHFLKGKISELAKNLRSTDDQAIESSLHTAAFEERRKRSAQARQLLEASPKEKSEDSYFKKWNAIIDSLGDVAKSDLANYVAHRRVIIDLVEDVLRTTPEGSHRREEVIHSIVFPRGKQSGEVGYEQQNLWLIDERLAFHEHLYSDVSIKRITHGDIESDLRPDLAIYESGFASFHDGAKPPAQLVLVELKQPGRKNASRDDPVGKTLTYVEKLKKGKAKTEGNAVIDIESNALSTVYILADWTADFRSYLDREDFESMPGDVGRYRYRDRDKIMFIAMSFERLLENARRRNRIFFKKLGIEQ